MREPTLARIVVHLAPKNNENWRGEMNDDRGRTGG